MNESESDIPKSFQPHDIEEKLYNFWESKGFFKASSSSLKPSYTIVMPPPNITGVLHMGHALVNVLQDVMIRYKRMCGFEVCWFPGTDHAGIATQSVVEKHLLATQGKKRREFSRKEFLKNIHSWKEKSQKTILSQLRKLGCSCDWERLEFTMSPSFSHGVKKAFEILYNKGLIYRGDYLVNWDPVLQTALSDDEVEYEERDSFLYFLLYPFEGEENEGLVVATTRPETIFGDVALAVSPEDERYSTMIGKKVVNPLTKRVMPVIGDSRIDSAFGTGVVKITPAHDHNDYSMGKDHNLPLINILNSDGSLNGKAGQWQGLKGKKAQEAVVENLSKLGFLKKIQPHKNRVGVSYRSRAVIEPYLSKQWFLKTPSFISSLRSLVKDKNVRLFPKKSEDNYFYWINNFKDWCLSRQLWWGHRIPIWYRKSNPEEMICYIGEEDIPPEVKNKSEEWVQDEDVLDTWFSSALWPLICCGWPETKEDFKKFYPTNLLITGHDILFFWVAKMLLMGEGLDKEAPFEEVFLHGLIYGKSYWRKSLDGSVDYILGEEREAYDQGKPLPKEVCSKWEKLSKSKGNVIDPLAMISVYGTDALRVTLCFSANQQPQIDLDYRRFEEFKNFFNKIWNGARFILLNTKDLKREDFIQGLDEELFSIEDRYLLSRMNTFIDDIHNFFASYSFEKIVSSFYDFFWNEFCSIYLEIIKPVLFRKQGTEKERINKQKFLIIFLSHFMVLLHPLAPFITEDLFQKLKDRFSCSTGKEDFVNDPYSASTISILSSESCMIASYPLEKIKEQDISENVEKTFNLLMQIVRVIRNIRGELGISIKEDIEVFLVSKNESLESFFSVIKGLVKISNISLFSEMPKKSCSLGIIQGITVGVVVPSLIKEKEKKRLVKEKERLLIRQSSTINLLNNEDFVLKADKNLIEKKKEDIKHIEGSLYLIEKKIEALLSENDNS